jgi:serine O-acetyltransferase
MKIEKYRLATISDPETTLKRFANQEKVAEKLRDQDISALVDDIMKTYDAYGDLEHLDGKDLPSSEKIIAILDDLMVILFPNFFGDTTLERTNIRCFLGESLRSLYSRLKTEVESSLKFICQKIKLDPADACQRRAEVIAKELLETIPSVRSLLAKDVNAAFTGDPAAKSLEEIILSYPCVYAIATYRIAHELYKRGVPFIPRIMSEHAHSKTGIDIHPGAMIGKSFFIDHGTGVVIGETSEIGDNVRIYQGVTLGGLSLPKNKVSMFRDAKRHPTIADGVIVYSGATILGGKTTVGERAIVGGNVWITSSIPSNTTVTAMPNKLRYKTN